MTIERGLVLLGLFIAFGFAVDLTPPRVASEPIPDAVSLLGLISWSAFCFLLGYTVR